MNAIAMARTVYSSAAAPIRTHQSTEADAFAKITYQLSSSNAQGVAGFSELVAALHQNRRLWVLMAGDVADDDNRLPEVLRARIFYLAEFTQIHTSKILDGSGDVQILIDINTAVMRGLRQQESAS